MKLENPILNLANVRALVGYICRKQSEAYRFCSGSFLASQRDLFLHYSIGCDVLYLNFSTLEPDDSSNFDNGDWASWAFKALYDIVHTPAIFKAVCPRGFSDCASAADSLIYIINSVLESYCEDY